MKTDKSTLFINSVNMLSSLLHLKTKELKIISKTTGRFYKPFDRKQVKANGKVKWRHIDNPLINLKIIQRKINKILLNPVIETLPNTITGGRSGQSIFTNASQHLSQEAVATIDLKDCFPKTDNKRIFKVWRNYFKYGDQCSDILTKLTTFQRRLPQGSPTSSSLCNLALLPLHLEILKYCQSKSLNLTQFVDDITISGSKDEVERSIGIIIKLIQKNGYSVRRDKIQLMFSNNQQKTTGLLVNKKISIAKKYRENVRNDIVRLSNKILISKVNLKSIIGKIKYINIVMPVEGDKLMNLLNLIVLDKIEIDRYELLTNDKDTSRNCKHTARHKYGK
jgi:hypothetical protein